MTKVCNIRCLQQPKGQTLQYIPDRPRRRLIVKGKRQLPDGNVKEYYLKGKELIDVNKFLNSEEREIQEHLSGLKQATA